MMQSLILLDTSANDAMVLQKEDEAVKPIEVLEFSGVLSGSVSVRLRLAGLDPDECPALPP